MSDFWDSYAVRYDRLMGKLAGKAYEILFEELLHDTGDTKKMLEVGTGSGLIAYRIGGRIPEITAIDLSPEMIKVAKKKQEEKDFFHIDFRVGDVCAMEFNDKSFDRIIASNILHLLVDPAPALKEMKRVLIDDGQIIIPTYCHGDNIGSVIFSRLMRLSGFRVCTRWSEQSFKSFVEENGFRILKSRKINGSIPLVYLVARKI